VVRAAALDAHRCEHELQSVFVVGEDPRLHRIRAGKANQPFFTIAGKGLANRTVRVKYLFFGYQSAVALVDASSLYVITYILNNPSNKSLPLIMGSMLIGAGLLMVASFLSMAFAVTRWQWVATLALFGISLGRQWFMDPGWRA
jgi:hypothetical protein